MRGCLVVHVLSLNSGKDYTLHTQAHWRALRQRLARAARLAHARADAAASVIQTAYYNYRKRVSGYELSLLCIQFGIQIHIDTRGGIDPCSSGVFFGAFCFRLPVK